MQDSAHGPGAFFLFAIRILLDALLGPPNQSHGEGLAQEFQL